MHGVSMAYSFDDADAAERHETQYFEIFGNRGIYHRGWSAVTKHRTPWQTTGDVGIAFDDDVWELYDGTADWTQAHDLVEGATREKLHELQRLFLIEATRYNVLPLDDRSFERVLPEISRQPDADRATSRLLLPGMGGLIEQHVVNWRNRSWSLTAQVDVPDGGANGVLLNLGGHGGGWSFYLKDGAPTFCYNLFGIDRTIVRGGRAGARRRAPGARRVRLRRRRARQGRGASRSTSTATRSATGRVERTEPIGFGYEYTDVGRDASRPSPTTTPGRQRVHRHDQVDRAGSRRRQPRPPDRPRCTQLLVRAPTATFVA